MSFNHQPTRPKINNHLPFEILFRVKEQVCVFVATKTSPDTSGDKLASCARWLPEGGN